MTLDCMLNPAVLLHYRGSLTFKCDFVKIIMYILEKVRVLLLCKTYILGNPETSQNFPDLFFNKR